MASMSPCTIEKDVVDEMKKFRRLSNKSTLAMFCKLMRKRISKEIFLLFSTMWYENKSGGYW
jgi:hypothetical protein